MTTSTINLPSSDAPIGRSVAEMTTDDIIEAILGLCVGPFEVTPKLVIKRHPPEICTSKPWTVHLKQTMHGGLNWAAEEASPRAALQALYVGLVNEVKRRRDAEEAILCMPVP